MAPELAARPNTGGWYPCFDGLRAIAATTVVLHHAGFATGASFRGGGGAFLERFDSGVAVFFVISGFLLYRPFVSAHLDGRPPMPSGRFYLRRALRIFPAYWVALTGVVLFFGVALPTLADAIVHYGLLQIYDTSRYFNAISQSWTLATEISFYLLVPAFAWVVRRAARRRDRAGTIRTELVAVLVLVGLGLAFRTVVFPVEQGSGSVRVLFRYWLPAHLTLFGVGMVMAVASAALAGRDREWRSSAATAFPYVSWAMAGLAMWVVAKHAGLPQGLADASPAGEWAKHLLYLVYATGLVLPAAFGPQAEGGVRRLLAVRPLAALGVISYGVYLWHQAWLGQVREWVDGELFDTPYWQVLLPALALTIVTATLSYVLVERSFLRLKHRRWAARPATAPGPNAVAEAVVASQPAP